MIIFTCKDDNTPVALPEGDVTAVTEGVNPSLLLSISLLCQLFCQRGLPVMASG
jgi:hypothetical protein